MARTYSPSGLGAGGRRLWQAVSAAHDLRPDQLRLLEDAAREADLIDALEVEAHDAPRTTKGSMGQLVAHPLLMEIRQHRLALTTMLRTMGLDKAATTEAMDAAERARLEIEANVADGRSRFKANRGGAS